MDLVNSFLNVAAPPFTFIFLCFFLPPFQLFKFFLSLFNSVHCEDMTGKVVLITGASSGIGEHTAYEYAKRGACLVLVARRERGIREVADMCRELGSPDALVLPLDVTNVDDCKRMVDSTIRHFGRLDHLVNNAGVMSVAMLEECDDLTNMRPVMDINFWGAVYATRFAIQHLRNSRGKIVVVSSAASWMPHPRESIYGASKAAMLQLFETLRVELWPDVKITIVTPGVIESEITKGKIFTKEGDLRVDQDTRDVQLGAIPVATVEATAKSIVNGALRGERYVTEPKWFRVTYFLKMFCPEVLEWAFWLMLMTRSGAPPTDAITKKMMEIVGSKSLLYPSSIHTPEVKAE